MADSLCAYNEPSVICSLQVSAVKESCASDSRRGSGSAGIHESSSSSHLCHSKDASCSNSCCESSVSALMLNSGRHLHARPPVPDTCAHGDNSAKSLMELLVSLPVDESDVCCRSRFVGQVWMFNTWYLFVNRMNRTWPQMMRTVWRRMRSSHS